MPYTTEFYYCSSVVQYSYCDAVYNTAKYRSYRVLMSGSSRVTAASHPGMKPVRVRTGRTRDNVLNESIYKVMCVIYLCVCVCVYVCVCVCVIFTFALNDMTIPRNGHLKSIFHQLSIVDGPRMQVVKFLRLERCIQYICQQTYVYRYIYTDTPISVRE